MIVHLPGGDDDPTRPDRPARRGPARKRCRRSGRAVLAEMHEDPGYLAFKESIGEKLSPSERFRLEMHRAGSAQEPAGSAQPGEGEP